MSRIRTIEVREGSSAPGWNSDDWLRWFKRVGMAVLIAIFTAATQKIDQEIGAIDVGPFWTGIVIAGWGFVLQTIRTWLFPQPPTPTDPAEPYI